MPKIILFHNRLLLLCHYEPPESELKLHRRNDRPPGRFSYPAASVANIHVVRKRDDDRQFRAELARGKSSGRNEPVCPFFPN
jgi:hypothetical protein